MTISGEVQAIGDSAFIGCSSMKNLILKEGIKEIGKGAFAGCASLDRLVIPNSVTDLGEYVFSHNWELNNIVLPPNITSIKDGTFNYCTKLTSLTIPDQVVSIGAFAFRGAGLRKLIIPNRVEIIENNAFFDCSYLEEIECTDNIREIGEYAFSNCSELKSIIPLINKVEKIKKGTFQNCFNLTSLLIPDQIKTIETYAFRNCYRMEKLVLGKGLESIGNSAFAWDMRLKRVESNATVHPALGDSVFYDVNTRQCVLMVPKESLDDYANADQWRDFTHMQILHEMPMTFSNLRYWSENGVLHIQNDKLISRIEVFDPNGVLIRELTDLGYESAILIEKKGVYIVRIQMEDDSKHIIRTVILN